jgi:predicted nucleic acid-binding protein
VIVVDTSVWIEFFNGADTPQARQLIEFVGQRNLLVGDLVMLEILQGFRSDRDAARVEAALSAFEIVAMLSPALAIKAASNYRRLRRAGITVRKTVDLVIGTYCIAYEHHLLHADRDFDAMRGLGLQTI